LSNCCLVLFGRLGIITPPPPPPSTHTRHTAAVYVFCFPNYSPAISHPPPHSFLSTHSPFLVICTIPCFSFLNYVMSPFSSLFIKNKGRVMSSEDFSFE
jgi:hypothetical protein